jgi:hypothetical protein
VRLTVDRVKSFDGSVVVRLSPAQGLELPERIEIPRGAASVEVEIKADAAATPGRRSMQLTATGDVDGFEEEQRGGRIDIDLAKAETPKK